MASDVDICNLALGRLGIDLKISSIAKPTSRNARLCAQFYQPLRQSVLREHSWKFAEVIDYLAIASGEEHPSYAFAYSYPSNAVFFQKIININGDKPIDFTISQGSTGTKSIIYTDVEDAQGQYTADVTDANLFDPIFSEALSWRLASELCMPILASPAKAQYAEQMYRQQISKAKKMNRSEEHKAPYQGQSLIDARA